jgi:hypothetical protein
MNAITINIPLLLACERNCVWCYLRHERQASNLHSNGDIQINELGRSIGAIINELKVQNRIDEPTIVYYSWPVTKRAYRVSHLINEVQTKFRDAGIICKEYHIGQPSSVEYICSNDKDWYMCISDPQDIVKANSCIICKRILKIMITDLRADGLEWEPHELENIRKLIDHNKKIGVMIERMFVKGESPANYAMRVKEILQILPKERVTITDCIECDGDENKCRAKNEGILTIETARNGGIKVGCPYIQFMGKDELQCQKPT